MTGAPAPAVGQPGIPAAERPGPRRAALLLVLLLAAGPLVAFALLDGRAPNDHDRERTDGVIPYLLQVRSGERSLAGSLGSYLVRGDPHDRRPTLAQSSILLLLGLTGPSVAGYRLAALPVVLLLALGLWWAGRWLASWRLGAVAAVVVLCAPAVLTYSRKWNLKLAGAALLTLCLAHGLRLVCGPPEGRRRHGPWVALGLALGLCVYTHPVTLLGAAALVAALLLCLIPGLGGGGWRWLLPRLALCGGCAMGLGAWGLGLLEPFLGAPAYALLDYVGRAGFKTGLDGSSQIYRAFDSFGALLHYLWVNALCEVWLPPLVGVLLLPGLAALAPAVALAPGDAEDRRLRRGIRLLALFCGLLLLPLLQTLGHGPTLADWILHLPPLALLCLAALLRLQRRWAAAPAPAPGSGLRRWAAAPAPAPGSGLRRWLAPAYLGVLLLISVATAMGPLLLGTLWADPLAAPQRYHTPALRLLTHLGHGGPAMTPLLPSPGPKLHRRLTARLRVAAGPGAPLPRVRLGFVDLAVDPGSADEPCPGTRPTREPIDEEGFARWPEVLGGLERICPARAPAPEWSRFHLVRLYLDPTNQSDFVEGSPRLARARGPACLERVRREVAQMLGVDPRRATLEHDPGPWLGRALRRAPPLTLGQALAPTRYFVRPRRYLKWAVVVDRGAGPVRARRGDCRPVDRP